MVGGTRGVTRGEGGKLQTETAGHADGVGARSQGWWRQGTSKTARRATTLGTAFGNRETGGLRESPTRPLRASLRVARWLNPAKSCKLKAAGWLVAAKEGRGAQGDAKGRAKGRKRDPTRRVLSFLPF